MPRPRCKNFDSNGSRKTWSNGSEMQCRPNCQFIHPSDPGWDGAPPPTVRERGGPRQGSRERHGSTATWDDYMTGFSSNPSASSSGWGALSHRSGHTTAGTDGRGTAAAGGSGWGSGDNNAMTASNGLSNERAALGEQASSSQWNAQALGWGPSDTGWGSAGTGLGPGWGEDSFSDQSSKPTTVANVMSPAGPSTLSRTWTNDNPGAGTATSPSSRAMPSISSPSEPDTTHSEQFGEDIPARAMAELLHVERKAPLSTTSPELSPVINPQKMRLSHGDHNDHVVSGDDGTSRLTLYTAMTLRIRELDAELSQLSVMRRSGQVAATRAAKELLRKTVHRFTDARAAAEEEQNTYSQKLVQSDTTSPTFIQPALTALGRDNGQFEPMKDWVSRAERWFNHFQAEGSPIPLERSNKVTFTSKLDQLKGRLEFLEEPDWQYQELQFYNSFLDHLMQDKKDLIVAALVKSQDVTYNHSLLASLSTLQKQGGLWNQTLQVQAEELAQALIQSDQLKRAKEGKSIINAENKGIIYQLQANIIQQKLQLQAIQEEIAQLQHALAPTKQQQQSFNPYSSHIQQYVQSYIQAHAIPNIKEVLSCATAQFTATELRTVEKVWKTLQPFSQISLWLQQLDIYKTEEEMEIREIEESL
ncbi:hypothetical protein F5148DRAFT_1191466 [Russula earlei]|uniref:Uncharacterized protein n=1 Tax=Russula earlei TaxID=71964 RepID=A0ACC0UB45_9AGAM|nr:hypothetical protein F5148DRAFT_1191466 [Russula earlei]